MVVKQPQFTRVEEPTLLCNHVIGRIQPWINGRNAQQVLAEFQQADVRVLHPRNKAFTCIRTNHETRDAGAIAKLFAIKLGMRIPRILSSFAVPFFNVWWSNVGVPSTPI